MAGVHGPSSMPPTGARNTNWFGRNWKWAVPVGCASILLVGCLFVALMLTVIFGVIRSSDAYTGAVAAAQASPAVTEALGTPVETGFFVMGSINVSGTSGQADLTIPLSGPKGSGTLYAQATKSAGQWNYRVLKVAVASTGEEIDLLAEEAAP